MLNGHRFEVDVHLKRGMPVVLLANIHTDIGLVNGSQGIIIDFVDHGPRMAEPQKLEDEDTRKHFFRCSGVEEFIQKTQEKKWPVVQFHHGPIRTIYPRCEIIQVGDTEPYSLLRRSQFTSRCRLGNDCAQSSGNDACTSNSRFG